VQFSPQSYTCRTKIKQNNGEVIWLTVPIYRRFGQLINEVEINYTHNWVKKHLETIRQNYAKSTYLNRYFPLLEDIYKRKITQLSELNITLIKMLIAQIKSNGIKIVRQSELSNLEGSKNTLLINICKAVGATHYLSGFGARNYNEEEEFKTAGIELIYSDFVHPEYKQTKLPFSPGLSIIDLLFNCGSDSYDILMRRKI
jgi:hypothetical protein